MAFGSFGVFLFWLWCNKCFKIYSFHFFVGFFFGSRGVFRVKIPLLKIIQDSFWQAGAPIETQAAFCRPVVGFKPLIFVSFPVCCCPIGSDPFLVLRSWIFSGFCGGVRFFFWFSCFDFGATGALKIYTVHFSSASSLGLAVFFLKKFPSCGGAPGRNLDKHIDERIVCRPCYFFFHKIPVLRSWWVRETNARGGNVYRIYVNIYIYICIHIYIYIYYKIIYIYICK